MSPLGSSLGNSLNLSLVSNAFPGPVDWSQSKPDLISMSWLNSHSLGCTKTSQCKVKVYLTNMSQHLCPAQLTPLIVCAGFFPHGEVLSFLLLLTHGTAKICLNGVWP